MAIFQGDEESWHRIDFATIAAGAGIASLDVALRESCREWLRGKDYRIATIDCAADFAAVCAQFSRWLRFEENYGHAFGGGLDALRDGFLDLDVPELGGVVLELVRVERLWQSRIEWTRSMLQIACEASRYNMARGRRFFTTCVVTADAAMLGATFGAQTVPRCWGVWPKSDPFAP